MSESVLVRWRGLVADVHQAYTPRWTWAQIGDAQGFPNQLQFERDCLRIPGEDWFMGLRFQPSGLTASLIHDHKIVGTSTAGQFRLVFGIWSKIWAGNMMLSRLRWERSMDWKPGSQIQVSMRLLPDRYRNLPGYFAERNARWYAEREAWANRKIDVHEVKVLTPSGEIPAEAMRMLAVPASILPKLQNHVSAGTKLISL